MAKFAVILPAAGASRRFRDKNYKKPFAPLAGRAVWLHSAERFLARNDVKQLIICVADADREDFNRKFGANIAILGVDVAAGGRERTDTVKSALAMLSDEVEYVAIHDAARPTIADAWISSVFEAAQETGAAILAEPVTATLKRVGGDKRISDTVDRQNLWQAQTPQVFRRDVILKAYEAASGTATDDAELVERSGVAVIVVEGSPLNRKITTREDLRLAEHICKMLPKSTGDGFRHPFADGDLFR